MSNNIFNYNQIINNLIQEKKQIINKNVSSGKELIVEGKKKKATKFVEIVKALRSNKNKILKLSRSSSQALLQTAKEIEDDEDNKYKFLTEDEYNKIKNEFDKFVTTTNNRSIDNIIDHVAENYVEEALKGTKIEEINFFASLYSGEQAKYGNLKDKLFNGFDFASIGEEVDFPEIINPEDLKSKVVKQFYGAVEYQITKDKFKTLLKHFIKQLVLKDVGHDSIYESIKDFFISKDADEIRRAIPPLFKSNSVKLVKAFNGSVLKNKFITFIDHSQSSQKFGIFFRKNSFMDSNTVYKLKKINNYQYKKNGIKSIDCSFILEFNANVNAENYIKNAINNSNNSLVLHNGNDYSGLLENITNDIQVFKNKTDNIRNFLFYAKRDSSGQTIIGLPISSTFLTLNNDISSKFVDGHEFKPNSIISIAHLSNPQDLKIDTNWDPIHSCFFKKDQIETNNNLNNLLFGKFNVIDLTNNKFIKVPSFFNDVNHIFNNNKKLELEDGELFFSPFALFVFLAIKLTFCSTSYVFEILKILYEREYENDRDSQIKNHFSDEIKDDDRVTYKTNLSNARNKSQIIFKTGQPADRIKSFVNDILNRKESTGTYKNKILELIFDTSLDDNNIKEYLNFLNSEQSKESFSGKEIKDFNTTLTKTTIEDFEDICISYLFDQTTSNLGRGEYLLIALLMGIDIPATIGLENLLISSDKDKDIEKQINFLSEKILYYSGGQETGDIDFRTHILPSACPTKDLIKDKIFEVKEGGSDPIRLGSEGIRALSKHLSKFYQKTTAIKGLFERPEGKKLVADICENIDKDPGIKNVIDAYSNKIGKTTAEKTKKSIVNFIREFFFTDLNKYIFGDSDLDVVYGEIENFNAGNFSVEKLQTVFLSYILIMKALQNIINKYCIINDNSNIKLTIEKNNQKQEYNELPLNATFEKLNSNLNENIKTSFEINLTNILDIIHDNEGVEVIKKMATLNNHKDSRILLYEAVKLFNKLKNIDLHKTFSNAEESLFKFLNKAETDFNIDLVSEFGDAEKSFEKMDGVFIIESKITTTGQHSDLRFLYIPKNSFNAYLQLKNVSKHLPSLVAKNIGLEVEDRNKALKSISFFKHMNVDGSHIFTR